MPTDPLLLHAPPEPPPLVGQPLPRPLPQEPDSGMLEAHALKFKSLITGPGKKTVPRLREFHRQGQAGLVSNSKNKILATWEPFFCRALYVSL